MAKILLVEDDESLADTMVAWLRMKNHHTTVAECGIDALEQMQYGNYDLVLLDGHLPDMNGIQVATDYRTAGGSLPLVMVTGNIEASERDKAIACGINEFLRKPFDLKKLEQLISRYCPPA